VSATSLRVRPQSIPTSAQRAPALAALELATIAAGVRVADQIVKTAPVELYFAEAVSPGKFIVVFAGGVGEVQAAFVKGQDAAGSALLDSLNLPQCHADVLSALEGLAMGSAGDALGVIELDAVPATLLAADKAAKTAPIRLRTIRLAVGLGGKGFVYLDGTVSDVNAAVSAATAVAGAHLVDSCVIPRLAEAVRDRLY
jgi:microcompartment protein CcmL/EutN